MDSLNHLLRKGIVSEVVWKMSFGEATSSGLNLRGVFLVEDLHSASLVVFAEPTILHQHLQKGLSSAKTLILVQLDSDLQNCKRISLCCLLNL